MVNRLVFPLILISVLWVLVANANASEKLSVEPDRTQLYQGEALTLTVKGTLTIDLNLSNLFDFDTSNLPQPDIGKVEDDFEIIGQNQQYSIRTVNGEMIGEVTWTYQLAPRKPGKLTIPSLTFRDATSDPIPIEVTDRNPPEQSNSSRDSFIELSADKDSVYVQEQLVLTVKLFFNGNMVRGELSEPSHPNAIIEALGKQTEYTRYRDGTRYRVVERRYAIFPQQPGELSLPPIRFEGQTRDASGRLKFLRDSKQLFTVPVKEIPDEFTGKTWLPATELTLSASGLPNNPAIDAGQNLSRTLSLVAEGLPAEALPPFSHDAPPGVKAYPDSPERTTVPTKQGLTAKLAQTIALVPVKGGEVTLPEIRIPWWDTDSDSQKIAVIPARELKVKAAAGEVNTASNQAENTGATQPAPQPKSSVAPTASATNEPWIWKAMALILLSVWIITVFAWWWYTKRVKAAPEPSAQTTTNNGSEKALFRVLCESARAGAPETPDHLVRWVQHCHPERSVVSLEDVFRLLDNNQAEKEIRRLQARAFSQNRDGAESWQGDPLVTALSECRKRMIGRPSAKNPLPPLYPDELNAGP